MARISLQDIQKIFIDIINGKVTLEEADSWAASKVQEEEEDTLLYSPIEDEDVIWEGIMYLNGIDLQETPGKYLHTIEGIRKIFIDQFGGDKFISKLP